MKRIKFLLTAAIIVVLAYIMTVNSEQNSSNIFTEEDNIALAEGGAFCYVRPSWVCGSETSVHFDRYWP